MSENNDNLLRKLSMIEQQVTELVAKQSELAGTCKLILMQIKKQNKINIDEYKV